MSVKYMVTADTDIGISRSNNQDSLLLKHALFQGKEVVMAIVCDGMGGLSKGEVASATVIREFDRWFREELAEELSKPDMGVIAGKWVYELKDLNRKIRDYGTGYGGTLGTTFTGLLLWDGEFIIVHVGDTRVYHLGKDLVQLTEDQTFIARAIARGTLTEEQAKQDKRRNMLLQCIGASDSINPQVIIGRASPGIYILCSDGFRHEITKGEIMTALRSDETENEGDMHLAALKLIDLSKRRGEKDNISVILCKAV